jgi:Arc/MetJ-type ribon-helix-helix transcriptional regulator
MRFLIRQRAENRRAARHDPGSKRRRTAVVIAERRRNISVSIPADLAEELDKWTSAEQTNRSALVTELLRAERRRRFEAELEEAYRDAAAEGRYDDIEFYLPAQAEVALANPW